MSDDYLMRIFRAIESIIEIKQIKELDEQIIDDVFDFIMPQVEAKKLTNQEINLIKNMVMHNYQIRHAEGTLILNDYEHESWYLDNIDDYGKDHWFAYEDFLIRKEKFPPKIVDGIGENASQLVNSLGNPSSKSPFLRRGLVLGDVQSGKTSNYLGLINKAVDAGYEIVILLTGISEVLRQQTQIRVEEGFIGIDIIEKKPVGVGMLDGHNVISHTSRKKDFTGESDITTSLKLTDGNKYIFVIKKNVSILRKLKDALEKLNTSPLKPQIDRSLLLIDDEADNASINTNKLEYDPTKTNGLIREILNLFTKSNYVGYTATPFANVFIDPETDDEMFGHDLFPEDFIFLLDAETNNDYFGPQKMINSKDQFVRFIEDYYENEHIFSYKHKKEWVGEEFFESLTTAIYTFLIAILISETKINGPKHKTMLVNVSRFINVQYQIQKIIQKIIDKAYEDLSLHLHLDDSRALRNKTVQRLHEVWKDEYEEDISWIEVKRNLSNVAKKVRVVRVNSSKDSESLDYNDDSEGLAVIAVGGLALSRGLTLQGLIVSYFFRNTSTFDVLMQMGRWFGYRRGYEEICRLWITEESFSWYNEIYLSTKELKNDIREMRLRNKKPRDFGIRVRNNSNELNITSGNKMRAASKKIERINFYGEFFENPYIEKKMQKIKDNYHFVQDFAKVLNNRDDDVSNPYFRDIDWVRIVDFLKLVNIYEKSYKFDVRQITDFMKNTLVNDYQKWDVLFMQGEKNDNIAIELTDDLTIIPVKRQFDIVDNEFLRIMKQRTRIGSPTDTKFGLDEKTIERINQNEKKKTQDYLIEGRNPLLIIYLINLTYENSDLNKKMFIENLEENQAFVVGFSVAFPKNETYERGNEPDYIQYHVNNKANYFMQQLILEEEDDDLYE